MTPTGLENFARRAYGFRGYVLRRFHLYYVFRRFDLQSVGSKRGGEEKVNDPCHRSLPSSTYNVPKLKTPITYSKHNVY
jgi:hypothetical protein